MGGWRYGTGRARTGYSPYWYLPRTALPPPLRPQPEIQVLPHCFSFIVSPYGSAYLYLLQLHTQLPFIHHNNQSSLIPKQTRTKRKEKRSYDLDSMVLQYVVLLCSSSRGGVTLAVRHLTCFLQKLAQLGFSSRRCLSLVYCCWIYRGESWLRPHCPQVCRLESWRSPTTPPSFFVYS